MEYTTLGRTGLKVSVAGLGCGGFSKLGLGTGQSPDHAVGIIRTAIDLGVNLIDTAAVYETEESLSGSAYVLGGHLSRTGVDSNSRKRVALNPILFSSLAVMGFLLLSLLVAPHVRRYFFADNIFAMITNQFLHG